MDAEAEVRRASRVDRIRTTLNKFDTAVINPEVSRFHCCKLRLLVSWRL